MEFVEYGSKNASTLIFIHGSCTTAETCYSKVAEALKDNYHCVLCRLDGHYDSSPDFVSLDKEAEQITVFILGANIIGQDSGFQTAVVRDMMNVGV